MLVGNLRAETRLEMDDLTAVFALALPRQYRIKACYQPQARSIGKPLRMLLILPNSPRTAESKEANFLKMLEFPGKPAKS